MYALRERRVHVTQEDFEMAVTKVGLIEWKLVKYGWLKLLLFIVSYSVPRISFVK